MCINEAWRDELVCTINDFLMAGRCDASLDLFDSVADNEDICFHWLNLIIGTMYQEYSSFQDETIVG